MEPSGRNPAAARGKCEEPENGKIKPKPLRWVATGCRDPKW
jgi:hypothetical protein